MPKHPLYVHYLSEEAQAVIGQVHPHTAPARAVLEAEGFRYQNYVDIFDGGPTLECDIDRIRAVRKSRLLTVEAIVEEDAVTDALPLCLVSNDNYHHYRVLLLPADPRSDRLCVPAAAADILGCQPGDTLRVVPLCSEEKKV